MILLATILHLVLPPLWILAMGRFAPRRGIVWTVVAGLALYEFSLLAIGLVLGYAGSLRAPGPLVLWSVVAGVLVAFAWNGALPAGRAARAALAGIRPRPVDAFIGLAAIGTAYLIGLQIARDWIIGTENFDSLAYHIPRALVWSWQGDFSPWPAAQWQQVGLPVGGDVLLLPGLFLGIGWFGSAWTTLWLSLGAAAAVFAVVRHLGAGRRASLIAALVFLSLPSVGMRLAEVNTDVAAAFPLVAAWALVEGAGSMPEAVMVFPALCGVGVASKAYVAPAVLVLAVALFASRLRVILQDRRALLAALAGTLVAALLCLGSYLPVRRLFGDFVGGDEGKALIASREGRRGLKRAFLFSTLHWLVEPFALVTEPRRFELLREAGVERAYLALGVRAERSWLPAVDAHTNTSGVFPLIALPWLLLALPKGKRLWGALLFLALLAALFAPVLPNAYGSRFAVVLVAAFAVLWGARAARSPGIVAVWLLAAIVVDAYFLGGPSVREIKLARKQPDRNARLAAAVGSHTLWVLNGPLTWDARIAGRRANVRFEYLTCPRDGDWTRLFAGIRKASPWLLLNRNVEVVGTGPGYQSAFGPACPGVPVARLRGALSAAGWRLVFQEADYQVWTAEPAGQSEDPGEKPGEKGAIRKPMTRVGRGGTGAAELAGQRRIAV